MWEAGPDEARLPTLDLSRLGPVLIAFAVGCTVSFGLFAAVRERKREQTQTEFERSADDLEVLLRTRIDANLDVLHSLARFYASSKSRYGSYSPLSVPA